MTVHTITSDNARSNWRSMLDLAATGETDVVIERHGKPTVALIGFEAYQAMQALLDELRALQRAERAMQEWLADPSIGRAYGELRAEMVGEGALER